MGNQMKIFCSVQSHTKQAYTKIMTADHRRDWFAVHTYLNVGFLRDRQAAVDRGGGGAPILVQLEAHRTGLHDLQQQQRGRQQQSVGSGVRPSFRLRESFGFGFITHWSMMRGAFRFGRSLLEFTPVNERFRTKKLMFKKTKRALQIVKKSQLECTLRPSLEDLAFCVKRENVYPLV